jgi:WD40 repeat protein
LPGCSKAGNASKTARRPSFLTIPEHSFLVEQITPTKGEAEMPSKSQPLLEPEIALIRRWIAEGAVDDTPPNARQRYDAEHPPVYHRAPVITSMDFSPDGSLLAVAGFHEVLLWKADGSELLARLVGLSERIQTVRFSPDGKHLAACGGRPAQMGEVQIWDVEKRKLTLSAPIGYDTVYGVSWSPDGKIVSFGCSDNALRAIDAKTGAQVLQQVSHSDWVLDTVFTHKGDQLVSVGRDMSAKLTEVATQRFVDNISSITPGALRGGLQSVARHPQRDEFLVGGSDGIPQAYRIVRKVQRRIGDNALLIRKWPAMEGRIYAVAFSPDGLKFAAASSLDEKGAVNFYNYDFNTEMPADILAIEGKAGRTPEEKKMLEDHYTSDVKLLASVPLDSGGAYALAYRPDGAVVAVGGEDGHVRFHQRRPGLQNCERLHPGPDLTRRRSNRSDSVPLIFDHENPPPHGSPPPFQFLSGNDRPLIASRWTRGVCAGALVSISLAFGGVSLWANALTPEMAKTPAPETLPAGAKIASLDVQPAKVVLTGRYEAAQLLVTAKLASGDVADVTRMAKLNAVGGIAEITPSGQIKPLGNGAGTIHVELAGISADVPVEVVDYKEVQPVDFIHDVNPTMTKLGCNAGTCHGAKEGKFGFKLSLRGYDPLFDVRSLKDDLASRRLNVASPDDSLMLLKATAGVPHEGGQRTKIGEKYYTILRQWIADGAKLDLNAPRVKKIEVFPHDPVVQQIGARQQVRIVATFTDGTTRDVTAEAFVDSGNTDVAKTDGGGLIDTLRRGEAPLLARYEGNYAATTLTVMGDRTGFVWHSPEVWSHADELVAAKWERMRIEPSDVCNDSDFLRRVYLDLTGLPPTVDDLKAFLADTRPIREKRDAVVDRLIGSPDFVEYWTNKWADKLQVNSKFLGAEGAVGFRKWIREQIDKNTPYDVFVREILTASGSNKDNPAASYWKILREPSEAMENTTQLFLATRFNCNKCHDHPFEHWTQDQYYHLGAFFTQVTLSGDPASGKKVILGSAVENAHPLWEVVRDGKTGEMIHLRTNKVAAPPSPTRRSPPSHRWSGIAPEAARRMDHQRGQPLLRLQLCESPLGIPHRASGSSNRSTIPGPAIRRRTPSCWITSPRNSSSTSLTCATSFG